MNISRELVLRIIKYLILNPEFYFPFQILNKSLDEDDENYYVEVSELAYKKIAVNYNTDDFILTENLQSLSLETVELMAKGFIDKIVQDELINKVSTLAVEYRSEWKEEVCESENIETYGFNEFIGGKAEAYEDCLEIVKKFYNRQY